MEVADDMHELAQTAVVAYALSMEFAHTGLSNNCNSLVAERIAEQEALMDS